MPKKEVVTILLQDDFNQCSQNFILSYCYFWEMHHLLDCRLIHEDPRAEPLIRERVPYVIVHGPPRATLISLVRQPRELLGNPGLRLNSQYYIKKQLIPPVG